MNAVGDVKITAHGEYLQGYFYRLYLPMHARFGPMVMGALLAFILPSGLNAGAATAGAGGGMARGAMEARPVSVAWWKHAARWSTHASAFGVLCVFLLPPPPPGRGGIEN